MSNSFVIQLFSYHVFIYLTASTINQVINIPDMSRYTTNENETANQVEENCHMTTTGNTSVIRHSMEKGENRL